MASDPSADSAPAYGARLRQRFPALSVVARVDDAVYAFERGLVTAAMLVMSGVVCINVLFQFLTRQRALLRGIDEQAGSVLDVWPSALLLVSVAVLARGAWAASSFGKGNGPMVAILTALTVIGFVAFGGALVILPSHVLMALLALGAGAWVAITELDRPRPLGSAIPDGNTRLRVGLVVIASVLFAVFAFRTVPERYSWTTKLALFLLLWTAFIGASMATHDARHLRVDAVRKAIPARWLPYYETASHLVAATFTAVFAYLAYLYLFDRLAESAAPNEIPDWIKVLAIPAALTMVTVRFLLRALAALLTSRLDDAAADAGGAP